MVQLSSKWRLLSIWPPPQVFQQPYIRLEGELSCLCDAADSILSPDEPAPGSLLGIKLKTPLERESRRTLVSYVLAYGGHGWTLDRLPRIHLLPCLGSR